ncbi:MAG: EamA family transporter [Saccharofermentans sp.]|nr:EamA family transporter [Saccharofermentans sp.]
MNIFIPVFIVVISNTIYHICAKSAPEGIDTFASLTITYLIGALFSLALYIITKTANHQQLSLLSEYKQLNWASIVLGLAIVGLEAGFMLMYKVGWTVSTAQIVTSAFLAVVLVIVGYFLFKESVSIQKIAGVAICLVGLFLINK